MVHINSRVLASMSSAGTWLPKLEGDSSYELGNKIIGYGMV